MKRNRRPASIFDMLFGTDDFESMFSFNSINLSIPQISMEGSGFPEDGDENFNKTEETVDTGTHTVKKEVWTSLDGTQTFSRTSSQSKSLAKSIAPPTTEQLKLDLKSAVSNQEYEKAIQIRDELKSRGEKTE